MRVWHPMPIIYWMSKCRTHTNNIPSHLIAEYHPYTWEHYSQYNNIPSHPIAEYHLYTWEHYSQYNNPHLPYKYILYMLVVVCNKIPQANNNDINDRCSCVVSFQWKQQIWSIHKCVFFISIFSYLIFRQKEGKYKFNIDFFQWLF